MGKQTLRDRLRSLAARAGLTEAAKLTPHGLRAGCATQMYMDGHSVLDIMLRGDWKSDCFMTYIRARETLVAANSLSVVMRAVGAPTAAGFAPSHASFR